MNIIQVIVSLWKFLIKGMKPFFTNVVLPAIVWVDKIKQFLTGATNIEQFLTEIFGDQSSVDKNIALLIQILTDLGIAANCLQQTDPIAVVTCFQKFFSSQPQAMQDAILHQIAVRKVQIDGGEEAASMKAHQLNTLVQIAYSTSKHGEAKIESEDTPPAKQNAEDTPPAEQNAEDTPPAEQNAEDTPPAETTPPAQRTQGDKKL